MAELGGERRNEEPQPCIPKTMPYVEWGDRYDHSDAEIRQLRLRQALGIVGQMLDLIQREASDAGQDATELIASLFDEYPDLSRAIIARTN